LTGKRAAAEEGRIAGGHIAGTAVEKCVCTHTCIYVDDMSVFLHIHWIFSPGYTG
jgi:hypothetical protein